MMLSLSHAPLAFSLLYINLDEHTEKRHFMESQFRGAIQPVRISAIKTAEIQTNSFDVEIVEKHDKNAGMGGWKNHIKHIYSKAEISLIMTYKKTMQYAIDNELSEPFIIFEDDVVVPNNTLSSLIESLARVPSNAQVLQYHVLNSMARQSFCAIEDEFIRWFPEHFSTAVTVVRNREVALDIASADLYGHHVLDYWLYNNFISYTHTRNWFQTRDFHSKINSFVSNTEGSNHMNCHDDGFYNTELKPPRMSMMTVTTSVANYYNIYKNSICPVNVHVHVITRTSDENLLASRLGNFVIYNWIQTKRFSKWVYFAKLLNKFVSQNEYYEYYITTDDDVSYRGFPWLTFYTFLMKHHSVVTGIPRESEFANAVDNMRDYDDQLSRDFFVGNNGDFWRRLNSTDMDRWTVYKNRRNIDPNDLNFIEQGNVVFEHKFLHWYMNQTHDLVAKMKELKSDWVIDVMWCGALRMFNPEQSCRMFVHPVWHHDSGSLTGFYSKRSGSISHVYQRSGYKLKKYAMTSEKFKRWIKMANDDLKVFAKLKYAFNPLFDPYD